MIEIPEGQSLALLFAILIGAGGFAGMIAAIYKLKPERESIIVSSAEGAVIVQSGVIADLREQIEALGARLDEQDVVIDRVRSERDDAVTEAKAANAERDQLRDRVDHLEEERDALRTEVDQLKSRVAELEGAHRTEGSTPA